MINQSMTSGHLMLFTANFKDLTGAQTSKTTFSAHMSKPAPKMNLGVAGGRSGLATMSAASGTAPQSFSSGSSFFGQPSSSQVSASGPLAAQSKVSVSAALDT